MGRDKATMRHPDTGRTMVEHIVAVLERRCAPVFVVAAPGQSLPALGACEVLRDDVRGLGPLPATGRGLRAAATAGCEWAFVSAVDLPNLSVDLVDLLAGDEGADIVVPFDGRDHFLAGIYRTALADRIDALVADGERRMSALTDTVPTRRVAVPAGAVPAGALKNVNAPEDLQPG